jgi:hypothetical protein
MMVLQKIQIQKEIYNKNLLDKTINSQFTQLTNRINREAELRASIENIDEFFRLYDLLFFDIPKEGSFNSHQYLVNESISYIGSQQENSAIQALLDEIASLRQDNLELRQQLADQGLIPQTPSPQGQYNDANTLIKGTILTQQNFPNNNTSATPGITTVSSPGLTQYNTIIKGGSSGGTTLLDPPSFSE